MEYVRLLTIAGSDSGGGAGVQADLKTFAALGVHGMSVITALTAQNTVGVSGIHDVPPDFVAAQLEAVFTDIGVDAVKIGMLSHEAVIRAVAAVLVREQPRHVVLDPVMLATSGEALLRDRDVGVLASELMPMASVITPNLPEASRLLGRDVGNGSDMETAAVALLSLGCRAVLIKGGHAGLDSCDDVLAWRNGTVVRTRRYHGKRVDTHNTHGTGCTLSAAIAAYLGRGLDLVDAVHAAKQYLEGALRAGAAYRLGRGHGPLGHFYGPTARGGQVS